MKIPPISSLLKSVMQECGLKQKDLASVMEVPLDRVKSLTSGKVQKLAPEETRHLVQALNLSAHWLATGEGEMFNPDGGAQFAELLVQLKMCSQRVADLGLTGAEALAARDIAYGVAIGRIETVRSGFSTLLTGAPTTQPGVRYDARLLSEVVTSVIEALADQELKLPSQKVAQLVDLIYEHEIAQLGAANEHGVQRTTERFLRLVAA